MPVDCSLSRGAFLPAAALFLVTLHSALRAQCATHWTATGYPGASGSVDVATMWDPDGPGPLPARLVVGGSFQSIGGVFANRIAWQDPVTGAWSPLGAGFGPSGASVVTLAALPNGDLVAGGQFAFAGGQPANNVARWNGSSWSPLGSGTDGFVSGVAALPNGDIVAAGYFYNAGGVLGNRLAKWDGSSWSTMNPGTPSVANSFYSLAVLPGGDLVVGGEFGSVAGVAAVNVARWDGVAWSPLGTGTNNHVNQVIAMPNGDVVAIGNFTEAGGQPILGIARWNGSAWSGFGTGLQGVSGVAAAQNGDVLAAGWRLVGNSPVARWNGSTWTAVGTGNAASFEQAYVTIELPGGDIVAAGDFTQLDGQPLLRLARWNGAVWSPLAPGFDGSVASSTTLPNGDIVVGGAFTQAENVAARHVARFDGSAWHPLGAGVDGIVNSVSCLPNGDVLGAVTTAPSGPNGAVMRWDGVSWQQLGGQFAGSVLVVHATPAGDVIAGGYFPGCIARWNGGSWTTLGGGASSTVTAIADAPDGGLWVGGSFLSVGGVGGISAPFVAHWDGTAWHALGNGTFGGVMALATARDGSLFVGGTFATAGGVAARGLARWNGSRWSSVGGSMNGDVFALEVLPDGDLIAGGQFNQAGGQSAVCVARWNGSSWASLGSGIINPVRTLTFGRGRLAVGGQFTQVSAGPSNAFAWLDTPCPAVAQATGAGCVGSAGLNQLAPIGQPWIGGGSRAQATGVPADSIALTIFGLAPLSIPLSFIHPQGVSGCTLQVTTDFVDFAFPVAGAVDTWLAIPDSSALVGAQLFEQVVPVEFDLPGNITALTASNALVLTIGAFGD